MMITLASRSFARSRIWIARSTYREKPRDREGEASERPRPAAKQAAAYTPVTNFSLDLMQRQ